MTKFEKTYLEKIIKDLELISKDATCSFLFKDAIELLKEALDYND